MSGKITLTPEVEQQILASIRAGGYPHVAAAAWGVPAHVWAQWQRWATGKKARKRYRELFYKVEQAQGQARLRVELAALEVDPRFWLKHGPGREQPGNPGWAAMAKSAAPPRDESDPLVSPELLQLFATMRDVLSPFPEALAVFLQTLGGTE